MGRGAAGGQDTAGTGGPVAVSQSEVHAVCQGHWAGRCSTRCRAREAIRAGTVITRRRRVAQRAAYMAAAAAARAMLNAVTASAAQAAFAG